MTTDDNDIEPVDADLDELVEEYPEGTIVLAEKENSTIIEDQFRAVVTSHSVVEQGEKIKYKHPGPRVNVSTAPPNYERVEEDTSLASALRPCEIIEAVGTAEEVDD